MSYKILFPHGTMKITATLWRTRPLAAGEALDFDGTNDYVTLPSTLNNEIGANQITLEAWINYSGAQHAACILAEGISDGNIKFFIFNIGGTSSWRAGFYTGTWKESPPFTLPFNQWTT